MKNKRTFVILVAAIFITALALLPIHETFAAAPEYGGILKISRSSGVRGVGFPQSTKIGETYVSWPCVESLLRLNEQGLPVPHLVESWDVTKEGKQVDLHLRKGVKFHDGTDFNAEAFKFFVEVIEPAAGRSGISRYIKSVEILDSHTARLHLDKWNNKLLVRMCTHAKIVSPKSFKEKGKKWCEKNPVGTGPFKFVKWEKDVIIKFERFDEYWGGKPYLDGIEWHIIADPLTQLASFLSGEHHIMADISPKNAKELDKKGSFNIVATPGQYHSVHGDGGNADSAWSNVKVRQASAWAIDVEGLAKAVGEGYWTVCPKGQLAQPGGWSDNPEVKGYGYDPEKAKKLLAEAGYPNGFDTTIYCINQPQYIVDYITAMQNQLHEVGIRAKIELMDRGREHSMTIGGGWKNGLHHVPMTWRYEIALMESIYIPKGIFCKSIARPQEYADLLTKAVAAPEFENVKKLVYEMQKLDVDKYAMNNWLFLVKYLAAKTKNVHDDGFFQASNLNWYPHKAWLSK